MNKRDASKTVEDANLATMEFELLKAKRHAKSWERKYTGAMSSAIESRAQLDALLGINECDTKRKPIPIARRSKATRVAAIAPATDWHVEEQVSSEATNKKNSFNLKEAEVRINRFYNKILELIEWQGKLAPVSELWHPLLGDLLSGYIHQELVESNPLSPTQACVFLQEMICSGIDLLLKKTKLPIYIPTCVGNHGRTTERKRIKTSYKNSYEWLLYKTLAKLYARNPRVTWMIGTGYHNTQQIMGRKVRFHHGDGLRYMGGVGGITIPVNKAIAQWDKASVADLDVFGHWHTFQWHYPKWVSCGSLMGYSEYSVEIKAEFQHPTQTFIVIDKGYAITQATPIFLTKPKRSNK